MEFRAGATANGTSAQEVALSKKNRHHAGDQKCCHGEIELAKRAVLFQKPADDRAEQAPCAGRTEACEDEDRDHDHKIGQDVVDACAVGDDGTSEEGHALGIDQLEAGSLNEGEGIRAQFTLF